MSESVVVTMKTSYQRERLVPALLAALAVERDIVSERLASGAGS